MARIQIDIPDDRFETLLKAVRSATNPRHETVENYVTYQLRRVILEYWRILSAQGDAALFERGEWGDLANIEVEVTSPENE